MKRVQIIILVPFLFFSCYKNSTSTQLTKRFWEKTPAPTEVSFRKIMVSSRGTLLASTGDYAAPATNDGFIYRSVDSGSTWTAIDLDIDGLNDLAEHQSTIFAGSAHGIYMSADDGVTWSASGLDTVMIYALASYSGGGTNMLIAGGNKGVFKSDDGGHSWTKYFSATGIRSVTIVDPLAIFAGVFTGIGASVYVSTDGGTAWTVSLSGMGATRLKVIDNNIYACGFISEEQFGGLFRSSDKGSNWKELFDHERSVTDVLKDESNRLYICGYGTGVQWQDPSSNSWHEWNDGLSSRNVKSMTIGPDNHLFIALDPGGIFKSRAPLN